MGLCCSDGFRGLLSPQLHLALGLFLHQLAVLCLRLGGLRGVFLDQLLALGQLRIEVRDQVGGFLLLPLQRGNLGVERAQHRVEFVGGAVAGIEGDGRQRVHLLGVVVAGCRREQRTEAHRIAANEPVDGNFRHRFLKDRQLGVLAGDLFPTFSDLDLKFCLLVLCAAILLVERGDALGQPVEFSSELLDDLLLVADTAGADCGHASEKAGDRNGSHHDAGRQPAGINHDGKTTNMTVVLRVSRNWP